MNILKKISNFWRWHPEVFIRYWPIVKQIQNSKFPPSLSRLHIGLHPPGWTELATSFSRVCLGMLRRAGKKGNSFGMQNYNAKLKILEVGSGWLGISPYLGSKVIGLDENFEGRNFSFLKQIRGNILNIPFGNNSFDFVVCVDVLEHLLKERRVKALEEILRVAKNEIFIGIPCGRQSYQQDKKLDAQYRKIFNQPFPFLQEHLEFGLPEESEIMRGLNSGAQKNHKKITIEVQGNENLQLREFLMKGWMTKNILIDFIYRKLFLLLILLYGLFNKPPYYRRLFFVKIES